MIRFLIKLSSASWGPGSRHPWLNQAFLFMQSREAGNHLKGLSPTPRKLTLTGRLFLSKARHCSNWVAYVSRAVAATAMLTEEAAKLTLKWKWEVLTPHEVHRVLEAKIHLWLTGNRLARYQTPLLNNPDAIVKTCNTLNVTSLMPTESFPDLTHFYWDY